MNTASAVTQIARVSRMIAVSLSAYAVSVRLENLSVLPMAIDDKESRSLLLLVIFSNRKSIA